MITEERREGDFSRGQKKAARRRADHRCEACGSAHDALYVHHDPPISMGGGKNSRAWALDLQCHKVADKLALEHGISLTEVRERWGTRPLEPYAQSLDKGKVRHIVKRVRQRIRAT